MLVHLLLFGVDLWIFDTFSVTSAAVFDTYYLQNTFLPCSRLTCFYMDLKFYFYYSEIVEAWPGLLFLTISLIIVQSLGVFCDV